MDNQAVWAFSKYYSIIIPWSSACWVEGVRVREGKRCFQLLVEAARRLLERASPSLGSV